MEEGKSVVYNVEAVTNSEPGSKLVTTLCSLKWETANPKGMGAFVPDKHLEVLRELCVFILTMRSMDSTDLLFSIEEVIDNLCRLSPTWKAALKPEEATKEIEG